MAEAADDVAASSEEDEDRKAEEAEAKDEEAPEEEAPSLSELLVQLTREVSVLAACEAQLAASRNLPQVRRTARDLAATVVATLAFLTSFALANVAALNALQRIMARWFAALLLSAVWLGLGSMLTFGLMVRAGQLMGWRWWRVFRGGVEESLDDLERARAEAAQALQETITRMAAGVTLAAASASVAVAADVVVDVADAAGDVAGGVVDVGGDILEASDEVVDQIAENLPAGSVVSQMWDVVLMPGRMGVRVATTVLRRGNNSRRAE